MRIFMKTCFLYAPSVMIAVDGTYERLKTENRQLSTKYRILIIMQNKADFPGFFY